MGNFDFSKVKVNLKLALNRCVVVPKCVFRLSSLARSQDEDPEEQEDQRDSSVAQGRAGACAGPRLFLTFFCCQSIADLLRNGKEEVARVKVEAVIRDDMMLQAFETWSCLSSCFSRAPSF
jgi:hypothetical protein